MITIKPFFGNITQQSVDVIVNAAYQTLRGGLGVDGAIHAAVDAGAVGEARNMNIEIRKVGGGGEGDKSLVLH